MDKKEFFVKNMMKLLGVMAITALITFAMTACPEPPITNEPGKLTINNLPQGSNYVVGVYNHSGAINGITEWATVASQVIAVSTGAASGSTTLYSSGTGSTFNQSGSFMVTLSTTDMLSPTVWYITGVSFTNGGATINYNDLVDFSGNNPGSNPGSNPGDNPGDNGGNFTHDIDSDLYGTWVDALTGGMLTITFASDGLTWGGSAGEIINTTYATYLVEGSYAWIANNDNISLRYSYMGITQTMAVYGYTHDENELSLTAQGLEFLTLHKEGTGDIAGDEIINLSAIQGVTIPALGGIPVTAITATDQYTGTVTWNGSPATFAASTTYTATITLTPKPGYTLQGIVENFFTVAGASTVNNSANSGEITATFPQTVGIEMVWIPAGMFTMGSDDTADMDASPPHQVTLTTGFYMGIYQVTQEQYQAVMGTNPSYFSSNPTSGDVQARRPVESVSWYDAIVFCNRLSIMEGLNPAYSISGSTNPDNWGSIPTDWNNSTWNTVTIEPGSNGYRLPTEAQWEYACRAGTTTAYNTGASISDDTGWYSSNSNSMTHEVGKKPANAWGLYDMHGNVREWCWDWRGDYESGAQTDPLGASSGPIRVIRGGWWTESAEYLRSAARGGGYPNNRYNNCGFRLVRP